MVYCGRPSRGCQRCRQKRLKCGQQRPSCIQCKTAQVDCSGYRNEIDIMFRDETLAVARKVANSHDGKASTNKKSSAAPISSDNNNQIAVRQQHDNDHILGASVTSHGLLVRVPLAPIEKAATAFLLTSYLEESSFRYIPNMYNSSPAESLLSNAVEAVALAAFSNEVSQPAILDLARKSYARSMHMASEALNSPSSTTTDETLASILLLSRFETLPRNCDRSAIFDSWSKHILGGLSIVQLRDQEQNFASPASKQMYAQVIGNFHLYRILVPSCKPHVIEDLKQKALEALGPLDFWTLFESRTRFQVVTEELSYILQAVRKAPVTEYRSILQRAIALENKSAQLLSVMSGAGWTYQVVHPPQLPSSQQNASDDLVLYSDVYHIYNSAHDAKLWNSARIRSLALNDALIFCTTQLIALRDQGLLPTHSSPSPSSTTTNSSNADLDLNLEQILSTSQAKLSRFVADTCDSAPQFLRRGSPDCTVGACCYLVWPLFVAARCDINCKDWVVDRLNWMAEYMKIPVARLAIEWLERPGDHWLYPYRDDFIIPFYTF